MMDNGKNVVLLVEDEKKLRMTIQEYLEFNDYEVIAADNGRKALDLYYQNNTIINLIILDVIMPELNGFQVLEEIREKSEVPVIMLTGKSEEEDQLCAFNKGADNYITKPFKLSLLRAHIDAMLKRTGNHSLAIRTAGDLKIETDTQQVISDHHNLLLTPKEYELLLYFICNINIVLTREQILDGVWGYDYDGEIRTVDTIVKQLRAKLTDKYSYIKSIYGVGYRFEV
jgi:Response regulators consisting of a CheY-like receiver domain and a winged-helix DNA-binding domain